MFCPQCKAEYRQGFWRCSDCDVELVYELPQEPHVGEAEVREGQQRLIWKGNDESQCVALCRELRNADITYRVEQISVSHDLGMGVKLRYELSVVEADCEQAKELLGIEGEFADACYDPDDMSEPEEPDPADALPVDDSPRYEAVRNDAYLRPWYLEDATVEIWSQDGDDISSGIEMALRENLIHCRLDVQDNVRKAFVLPEDEARARGIVREIIQGAPPERH